MGFLAKKFANELDKELQVRLDTESEARENARFLRELLQKERAESLFWRTKALALMEKESKEAKGGSKNGSCK